MFSTILSLFTMIVSASFNHLAIGLVCVLAVTFYRWYTRNYGLWKSLGVPGPRAKFPWGSDHIPFLTAGWKLEDYLYKHADRKFCGFIELMTPVLYVANPDLIRAVTIKDFDFFMNRRSFVLNETFKGFLTILKDKEWKSTRAVMSPTFSASKLKGMHELCAKNSDNLVKYIEKVVNEAGKFECKDAFGRFTMDNMALCAFGVNCNSFTDPDTAFATHANKIFSPPSWYGLMRIFTMLVFPRFGRFFPDPTQEVFDFFSEIVTNTLRHREVEGGNRRDFLQLMIDTKDKEGHRLLSDRCILDQSVLFLIAGYDTTATLLKFAAFSLAVNPDIQTRVQEEIDICAERHGGEITYDAVMEMTYLDRVISETLRLYPPAIKSERESKFDYTLPGTDIVIPKGTVVQFPIYSIQRDDKYFPDPLKFDPDRFLTKEKESRHPCTYLPFGSGPRNCIAMRFALFEAKIALAAVMREMNFVVVEETPPTPLEFGRGQFLLTPKGDKIFLTSSRRNNLSE